MGIAISPLIARLEDVSARLRKAETSLDAVNSLETRTSEIDVATRQLRGRIDAIYEWKSKAPGYQSKKL